MMSPRISVRRSGGTALHVRQLLFSGAVLLALFTGGLCAAQSQPGCVLQFQDHYQCHREAFQSRLAAAHTISVSVGRMDLFAAKQVAELVSDLDKVQAAPGAPADLVFELSAIDRSGRIDFGPNDYALATLNVYAPARGGGRRKLIWAETFDGQEDRPWPGTVVDLIRQFQRNALAR